MDNDISLRDWFAGIALPQCVGSTEEEMASNAYIMADAMLAARDDKMTHVTAGQFVGLGRDGFFVSDTPEGIEPPTPSLGQISSSSIFPNCDNSG